MNRHVYEFKLLDCQAPAVFGRAETMQSFILAMVYDLSLVITTKPCVRALPISALGARTIDAASHDVEVSAICDKAIASLTSYISFVPFLHKEERAG